MSASGASSLSAIPPRWAGIAASLLPGLLLGVLFTLFLFFLNPGLPFSPRPIARGMALYGLSGALAGGLALAPFGWRRPRRALRLLPWGITAALGLAAVLGWVLPSYFAFFLPPGINVRLIKAALWLTVSALVCFYTALLHSLARRRYGPRSRAAFVLFTLCSILVLGERRGAFSAPVETSGRPVALAPAPRPHLLVVGLDAATLDAILPLAEQGLLPFFSRLIEGGSHGHLRSLRPHQPVALWTTLATGRLPYKHGVVATRVHPAPALGRGLAIELLPPLPLAGRWARLGTRSRRADAGERQVLAVWEILARFGVPTGVVGWPLTSPVSHQLDFTLSDRYFADPPRPQEAWPPDVGQRARLFQMRPADLEPGLSGSGGADGGAALAGDLWRQSLAAFLLEQQRPTAALFVTLPGLRSVTRDAFGGYSAVRFEGLQRSPYLTAAQRLETYYTRLDAALEELVEHQPQPGLLVVVSAFGAEAPRGWRRLRAELSAERAVSGDFHRSPDGILLLYGAGVRPGGRLDGAQLVDVVPTLLYGLDFPIARDLDGQVLREAFAPDFLARHPLSFVPSYEALPALSGATAGK